MTGVDNLRASWAKGPPNCNTLLLGDLDFDFWVPQNERDVIIADFIDKINLVNVSRNYVQQRGR